MAGLAHRVPSNQTPTAASWPGMATLRFRACHTGAPEGPVPPTVSDCDCRTEWAKIREGHFQAAFCPQAHSSNDVAEIKIRPTGTAPRGPGFPAAAPESPSCMPNARRSRKVSPAASPGPGGWPPCLSPACRRTGVSSGPQAQRWVDSNTPTTKRPAVQAELEAPACSWPFAPHLCSGAPPMAVARGPRPPKGTRKRVSKRTIIGPVRPGNELVVRWKRAMPLPSVHRWAPKYRRHARVPRSSRCPAPPRKDQCPAILNVATPDKIDTELGPPNVVRLIGKYFAALASMFGTATDPALGPQCGPMPAPWCQPAHGFFSGCSARIGRNAHPAPSK